MSCYYLVNVTSKLVKDGSTLVLVDHDMTDEFKTFKKKILSMDKKATFKRTNNPLLKSLSNPYVESIKETYFNQFIDQDFIRSHSLEQFDQIKKMMILKDVNGTTIAHVLADKGYPFTIEQLIEIGDPKTDTGDSVSLWMAGENTHDFTFDEIMRLGNPINENNDDDTIGFEMTAHGKMYTLEQILTLEKGVRNENKRMAINMINHRHVFSNDEIEQLIESGYPREDIQIAQYKMNMLLEQMRLEAEELDMRYSQED